MHRFILYLAVTVATVLGLANMLEGNQDATQYRRDQSMTPDEIQTFVRTQIVSGVSRKDAEARLQALGIDPMYVPRDEFSRSNFSEVVLAPPPDAVGALTGATGVLERDGMFEVFAIIVVYVGADDAVTSAGVKILNAGP